MRNLRMVALVSSVFLVALVFRVRQEHSALLEAAKAEDEAGARGILLAESARWTWPVGDARRGRLAKAMEMADDLRASKPDEARAIAEEVRATLYATRVGKPGHPEILARANKMIVDLLAQRDNLDDAARTALAAEYARFDGPRPGPYAGSAFGFCLWLVGLWGGVCSEGRARVGALVLAAGGLALFLGFLAVA